MRAHKDISLLSLSWHPYPLWGKVQRQDIMNLMELGAWTADPQESSFIPSLGLTPKVFAEETHDICRIEGEPSRKAARARHQVTQDGGIRVASVHCGDGRSVVFCCPTGRGQRSPLTRALFHEKPAFQVLMRKTRWQTTRAVWEGGG